MKPAKLLRSLVLADVTIVVAGIVAALVVAPVQPEPPDPGTGESVVGLVYLVLWIAAVIGLWRFRSWARGLYVVMTAAGIALTLLMPASPTTPLEVSLYGISFLISGALIAVSYYSPVALLFRSDGAAA